MTPIAVFNQLMSFLDGHQSRLSSGALQWLRSLVNRVNDITPSVGDLHLVVTAGTVPNGWLVANGAAVSRTTYAALFALVGTTYGAGNGTTTFNLPNLTLTGAKYLVRT